MTPTRNRGFSLVEGLVCLSISSLLMAVAVPGSGALMQSQRQQGQASQFVADFQQARMHAVGNGAPVHLRFHQNVSGTGYTLHQGPRDGCEMNADGQPQCEAGAHLLAAEWLPADRGVQLRANVTRMTLNPGTMTVTPTGSVSVLDTAGRGSRHTVAITGRVRSEVLR